MAKPLPRNRFTPILPAFKDIKDEGAKRYAEGINKFLQDLSGKLFKDLYDLIGQGSSVVIVDGDIVEYIGDPDEDGSWKRILSGNNLEYYHKESSAWVKRGAWTGK